MMGNKLDYKILLGSFACQLVRLGFEPYHTVMRRKMTRGGQAKCLVIGPASTPGSAVEPRNRVCPLLTTVQVLPSVGSELLQLIRLD